MALAKANENQYSMEESIYYSKKKLEIKDFLNKKLNEEKTYYVCCDVEYGDHNEDNDSELDTMCDEFHCYVHARSKEEAMLIVDDIFVAEYGHYDFNFARVTYAEALNINEVFELTQRTDLQKKYTSFKTDYVLCKSNY